MKVFLAGLATETNTFSPFPTTLKDFRVIRSADMESGEFFGGWFEGINTIRYIVEDHGWEFSFGLAADAEPAGITLRSAYEQLRDELLTELKAAMPVDIVMLNLHGAMVAQGYDDCESDLVSHVRKITGPYVKIGVELDLHCHLSQTLIDNADIVITYKEYPHTDVLERAKELLDILADAAAGKINPVMAIFDCRMIGLYPTSREPIRSFINEMTALEGQDGILSISLAHGFPWGDVEDMGTRLLVAADNNLQKAQALAKELAQKFFSLRYDVDQKPTPLKELIDHILEVPPSGKPVVLADITDNPGGGAPGDSTFALRALLERGVSDSGVAMIWDPVVVNIVKEADIGSRLRLRIGGKMGAMSGDPLDLSVEVIGVIPNMVQEFPQINGDPVKIDCGDSVALRCQGIDIIVNSIRTQVLSPQVFTNFGINLSQKRCLVVKSTQHFYAAYAPVAAEIFYMGAPGALVCEYEQLSYTKASTDRYPWVDKPLEHEQR